MKYKIIFYFFIIFFYSDFQYCMSDKDQFIKRFNELPRELQSKIIQFEESKEYRYFHRKSSYEPLTLNTLEPIKKKAILSRPQPGDKCCFRTQFVVEHVESLNSNKIRLNDNINRNFNTFLPKNSPRWPSRHESFCDGPNKNGFAIVATNDNSENMLYIDTFNINNPYSSFILREKMAYITASCNMEKQKIITMSLHNEKDHAILITQDTSEKTFYLKILNLQLIPKSLKEKVISECKNLKTKLILNSDNDLYDFYDVSKNLIKKYELKLIIDQPIIHCFQQIRILTDNLYLALDDDGRVYSIFKDDHNIEINKKTITYNLHDTQEEDFFSHIVVDPIYPKNIMLVNRNGDLFSLRLNSNQKITLLKETGHFPINKEDKLWLYNGKLGSLDKNKKRLTIQKHTLHNPEYDVKKNTFFQNIRHQCYLYSSVAYIIPLRIAMFVPVYIAIGVILYLPVYLFIFCYEKIYQSSQIMP